MSDKALMARGVASAKKNMAIMKQVAAAGGGAEKMDKLRRQLESEYDTGNVYVAGGRQKVKI